MIVIFSTYPPGYGGVSIHTMQLLKLLDKQKIKYKFIRLNANKIELVKEITKFILSKKDYKIIHFHTSFFSFFYSIIILLIIFKYQKKSSVYTSIHDGGFDKKFYPSSKLRQFIIKFIIEKSNTIIVMSRSQSYFFKKNFKLQNLIILSPYIPQNKLIKKVIIKKFELSFITIIQYSHVYGVFEILRFIFRIYYKTQNTIKLSIIASTSNENVALKKEIVNKILKIKKKYPNIIINLIEDVPNENLSNLYGQHNYFIRNTSHDSFGISVAEAIDYGLITFATDVCERYPGTFLYPVGKLRSIEEFILKNPNNLAKPPKNHFYNLIKDKYINLYSK